MGCAQCPDPATACVPAKRKGPSAREGGEHAPGVSLSLAVQRVGPTSFIKRAQRTLMPVVPHTPKARRTFALPGLSTQAHNAAVALFQQP